MAAAALLWLTLAVGITPARAADANPPERLTYQGYVTDANGIALGAANPKNYDIVFRIWDAQANGNELWAEQQTVTVDKGYFSVLLGEGSVFLSEPKPLLSTLFASGNASDRYVELMVKGVGSGVPPGDVTVAPRLRLLTSPYSFLARNALNAVNATSAASAGNATNIITGAGTVIAGTDLARLSLSQNFAGTVSAMNLAGDGSAVSNLNASFLTSGTLADARLSGNVPKLNANQTFSGQNTFNGQAVFNGGAVIDNDLNMGWANNNYHKVRIGTGNSSGYAWGYWPAAGEALCLSENYYLDSTGTHIPNTGLGTSLIRVDAGAVSLCTGPNNTVPSNRLHIDNTGKVGIGITSPGYELDLQGSIRATGHIFLTGDLKKKSGNDYLTLKVDGANTQWTSSDHRLKEDIVPISNAIESVKQLHGVTYHWNEDGLQHLTRDIEQNWKSGTGKPEDDQKLWAEKRREKREELGKTQMGFVAQDVERVFPDWVRTDDKGFKQINVEHLNAVLVNAVNEQQSEIEALRASVKELQATVKRLSAGDK